MTVKVAINGFGRIGRLVARAILERDDHDLELVAINDLAPAKANALLFKRDSVHGPFPGTVEADGNDIIVNGKRIHVTAERQVVLLATGSEVALAVDTAKLLEAAGIGADVISMPGWREFDAQDAAYRADMLPADTLKVSVEAGVTLGWQKYVGSDGLTIGIDSFGASGPAEQLFPHFGFAADQIAAKIKIKLAV